MSVPFNDLLRRAQQHQNEYVSAIQRVIASGTYVLGIEGRSFETAFGAYIGTKHCIGVNSGTDALVVALRALGVSTGDEVITVPNTAVPTVAAIRMIGAVPVFCDIDDTYTMDPNDLKKRITSKTKVIIPVHLYGFPAALEAISSIAKEHGLKVLEDAAQSHGATINGRKVGSFGDAAAFSFYPTKNLGALGDGGAIVTNDDIVAERARRIRMYGEKTRYESVEEGVNSRLDEIQAAILSGALPRLDEMNGRREEIASRYIQGITNPEIVLPRQNNDGRKGVWHLFVIQVEDRAHFIEHMRNAGIGTAIHYPIPIYAQAAYAFLDTRPSEYPMTEKIVPHIVSLPLFPELTNNEVELVISAANSYTR